VIIIFIRKALDYVFSKDELRVLDSIIPPLRNKSSKKKPNLENTELGKPDASNELLSTNQKKTLTQKCSSVNISNEVVKSGVWIHVNQKNATFQMIE